nr:MAG TPA: hypothetical protein [Caudoviricetes sp.]
MNRIFRVHKKGKTRGRFPELVFFSNLSKGTNHARQQAGA